MGLVYSKGESLNVIQAMEGNLTKAETILGLLTSASQKLTGVLGVELKGKSYSSGLAVFDDIILPTMKNARIAIEELSQGLSTYRHYDNVMPNEVLDEDNLNEQIRIRRNMMRSLDYHIRLLQQDSSGDNLVSQTNLVNDLYAHISTVEHEIRLLQEKLRKLGEFSSRTSGLFSKGSDYLRGVLRGVNVLNHATVNPITGTYVLTDGVSLLDLHVPDADVDAKAHNISSDFKMKVDGMSHAQLVKTFPYLSTLNPFVNVSDPAEIHRRRYVLLIAEIKRLEAHDKLTPKPQMDDRLAQFYAHIRKTGIDPTTGEAATSYQKWIAKHYSAISTGLSIAQISAGLWAGYRVYKSEVPKSSSGADDVEVPKINKLLPTLDDIASDISTEFNGNVTQLKNGFKVEIGEGKRPIVVRIMREGSGGRSRSYYRISVDGKGSLTEDGVFSSDRGLTHIDIDENSVSRIKDMINRYIERNP